MTEEQRKLVKSGRLQAQRLYSQNLNCVYADEERNKFIAELAYVIDKLCDDLEGCDSEKSFMEHFAVLLGGECWWSKSEDAGVSEDE